MTVPTPKDNRHISRQESAALFDLVQQRLSEALCTEPAPAEVWLGPKQARVLEVELNWQAVEGRQFSSANLAAMISGNMEGTRLMGLRVRLTDQDGVHVGPPRPREPLA